MVLRTLLTTAFLIGITASPQTPSSPPQPAQNPDQQQEQQSGSANELVKATIQNELKAIDADHTHWMYQLQTQKAGVTETEEVVETPHGDLKRVVARNGRPLSGDEQKQEDAKVQKFVADTGAQQKQRHDLDQDGKQSKEMLAMLPDAFIYAYAGHERNNTKLTFTPNPDFHPPSREATVFHAMQGQMVIDTNSHRLVEFSGHLTHPVKFGGGILGDLKQGGSFDVRQQEAGPGHWEISLLKVDIQGKALFFKTITVQQDEQHSHFKRVPDDLTVAQAKDLAMKPQAPGGNPQSGS